MKSGKRSVGRESEQQRQASGKTTFFQRNDDGEQIENLHFQSRNAIDECSPDKKAYFSRRGVLLDALLDMRAAKATTRPAYGKICSAGRGVGDKAKKRAQCSRLRAKASPWGPPPAIRASSAWRAGPSRGAQRVNVASSRTTLLI